MSHNLIDYIPHHMPQSLPILHWIVKSTYELFILSVTYELFNLSVSYYYYFYCCICHNTTVCEQNMFPRYFSLAELSSQYVTFQAVIIAFMGYSSL